MGRLSKSSKLLRHHRSRHFNELNRRARRSKTRQVNVSLGLSRLTKLVRWNYKFRELPVPENFSFVGDPDTIIPWINKMGRHLDNGYGIHLNWSATKRIGNDALALLLAHITSERFKHTMPFMESGANSKVQEILTHSHYYEKVLQNPVAPTKDLGYVHERTERTVEPSVAKELRRFASTHTLGIDVPVSGIFRTFIECMANTRNHAGEGQQKERWLVSAWFNERTGITSFSFVDIGKGILRSLEERDANYYHDLLLSHGGPCEVLLGIFERRIGSRKVKGKRGKGLPGIFDKFRDGSIAGLTVITNDVHLDFERKQYTRLKNSLNGTFIYWQLRPPARNDGN